MPPDVPPPTDVLTLVVLAWASGTAVIGAMTRLWGEIDAGHFKVIWLVVTGLSVAAGFGSRPAWVVAALALLTFVAIYRRLDRGAGIATAVASVVALVLDGPIYGLAAALLLGAVSNAMLLGHWHLNQPRLGTRPIARLVWVLWAGLALFIAASALLLAVEPPAGIRSLGAVVAITFAVFSLVLTAMVHHLVHTRSIMSATGILYLEVLLCTVAVFTGSLGALAAP